jgi:predicted O-methyltransferase YrrM
MLEFDLIEDFANIESVIIEEDWNNIFDNNKNIPRREYYNYYYSYGNSWKPNSILEIGVRFGYSAVSLTLGSGDSLIKFLGIDAEIDAKSSSNIAQNNLQAHTKAEVNLVNLDTQKDNIPDDIGQFDLIHIDADHTFHGCINDILLALSLSKIGTKIIVDDCLYAPVRAAFEAVKKIYCNKLESKYVTNFRGHGLIETLDTFYELLDKDKKIEIINQQKSPFTKIPFSSITNNYAAFKAQISQPHIEVNDLPNDVLDFMSEVLTEVDSYLKEAMGIIKCEIIYYQNNGFCVHKLLDLINNLIELEEIDTKSNEKNSFIKRILGKKNITQELNVSLCKKIYARLYLLNQIRLLLISNPLGKCFSYFCRESTKHFDYLLARIDKEGNSSCLPLNMPGLQGYRRNKSSILITHEKHLLLIVLSDALINIISCFEYELEAQYWIKSDRGDNP